MSETENAVLPQQDGTAHRTEPESAPFVPALIVVDMQYDFVYGSLAVPGGSTIIEKINSLIDLPFKVKIATRDFHPGDHVSFAETHHKPVFSKTTIYHPDDKEQARGVEQVLWPVHCVATTGGADFVEGLNATAFDAVVHKGTHPCIESYSAFKDIWGKSLTALQGLLAEKGVTDVYFVGLAGDYCVKYTALDALEFGYKTWLVEDGIKSIKDDGVAFEEMAKKGMHLTTTKEVQELLAPNALN
ncbi:pyrazinamidase/nicotinamidase [Flammula alnicola]|nr:pyrazinamidase/nicotinamidase [Flammula alnicola]